MKKVIFLFIFVVVIVAAYLTNPNEQSHKNAAKQKLENIVETTMNDFGLKKSVLTDLGFSLGDKYVDDIINQYISSDNYYLCSTTKINFDGKSQIIGVGAFNKVWISDKVDDVIKEKLKESVLNGLIR